MFNNITVNLRTKTAEPHNPGHFITKRVAFDYNPEAGCPLFLATLARLMGRTADASEAEITRAYELVSALQRAFGYALTGHTSEKVVFILFFSPFPRGVGRVRGVGILISNFILTLSTAWIIE